MIISNLNKKWKEFNEERETEGLPPIPFDKWVKEYNRPNPLFHSIEYLGLDREGPNWGTRNKQELMRRMLEYLSSWRKGSYDEWRHKLSNRLGLSPRTVKENYLDPLIKENIITRNGSQLEFTGPPEEEHPDDQDEER